MIDITPLEKIGHANHGWLDAYHHFSFGDYFDPKRMGFGPLRVWNDDLFQPGTGFPTHPHRDMEIITYIREGEVTHEDNTGSHGVTGPGQVQVMSAGTGIRHSEYNLGEVPLRLFQIWIEPDNLSYPPRYETRTIDAPQPGEGFKVLVSGRHVHRNLDVLSIHQDAALLAVRLPAGGEAVHAMEPGRAAYLVPAKGPVTVNGRTVPVRAGVAIAEEDEIRIHAETDAEVVLLDLP